MTETTPRLDTIGAWITLKCRDADAMLAWLAAIGFTEHLVQRGADPTVVEHSELLWPGGGGVMLGTDRGHDGWPQRPGTSAAYLVTDDVDRVYAAAMAGGASSLQPPTDQDYGARMANVTDPEGNLWSIGDYRPA